jgi:hypothetical protein
VGGLFYWGVARAKCARVTTAGLSGHAKGLQSSQLALLVFGEGVTELHVPLAALEQELRVERVRLFLCNLEQARHLAGNSNYR